MKFSKKMSFIVTVIFLLSTALFVSNAYVPDLVTGVSGIYSSGYNKVYAIGGNTVRVGYSQSYVLSNFGSPQRTELNDRYGYTWYVYEGTLTCKIGIKDGSVAAIYINSSNSSFNQLDYDSEGYSTAQRVRIGITTCTTVRSYFGTPIRSSNQQDVFLYDNTYITVDYDSSLKVTAMTAVNKELPYLVKVNPGRTEAQLQSKWQTCSPRYSGGAFAVAPSLSEPYTPGSLNSGFIDDGLNMLNFVRYTVGYPETVTLSDTYTRNCQYGAVLNQLVTDPYSSNPHNPARPAGMVGKSQYDDFYNLGRSACASSNIMWASGMGGTLWWDVEQWLVDYGVPDLGHRTYMLRPGLDITGFGMCGQWSNMYVFGGSGTATTSYECLTWPSNGCFPTRFFSGNLRWSAHVSLANMNKNDVKVKITRKSDGTVWNLSSASLDVVQGQVLIFSFDPGSYSAGTEYNVQISDIAMMNGEKAKVEYNVKLVNLN